MKFWSILLLFSFVHLYLSTVLTAAASRKVQHVGYNTIAEKKHEKYGVKKNLIDEPDEEIILKEEDHDEGDENKRDILILPEANPNLSTQQVLQTIQNALAQNDNQEVNQQPIISVNVGGSRKTGITYDSYLAKNQEESMTDILPNNLYESDPDNQLTEGSESLSSNPEDTDPHGLYDEYFPDGYKSAQGLQDSEEKLISKLIVNPPKGTSRWENREMPHLLQHLSKHFRKQHNRPSYSSHYNHIVDTILLDKILDEKLNQRKQIGENCTSVPLSHIENCGNSTDVHCKDDDLETFRQNGLFQHQHYRTIHHTTPVELNDKLNQGAQEYADKLAYADKLSYSDPKDRPGQGENIAVRCSDDGSMLSAKDAVSYWYHKICKDTAFLRSYSPEIGQFSQIVWKETNFIGLGRSTRNKGDLTCTYIVARYSPQASKSAFLENVPRGDFDDEKSCPTICTNNTERSDIKEKIDSKSSATTEAVKNLADASKTLFNKMEMVTDTARNESEARMSSLIGDKIKNLNSSAVVHNGSVLIPVSSTAAIKANLTLNTRSSTERADKEYNKLYNKLDEEKHPAHIIHLPDSELRSINSVINSGLAFRLRNSSYESLRDREKSLAEENRQSKLNQLHNKLKKNSNKNPSVSSQQTKDKKTNKLFVMGNYILTKPSGEEISDYIKTSLPSSEKKLLPNNSSTAFNDTADRSSSNLSSDFVTVQPIMKNASAAPIDSMNQSSQGNVTNTELSFVSDTQQNADNSTANLLKASPNEDQRNNENQTSNLNPDGAMMSNATSPTFHIATIEKKFNETKSRPETFNTTSSSSYKTPTRATNGNPNIMIFINKQNKGISDSKSQVQNAAEQIVSNIQGSHGENLTIVESPTVDSNGLSTREMLQEFFTEFTKPRNTDSSSSKASFLQLIPSSELADFRHGMLTEHNMYRQLHRSPPLQMDVKLNKEAQLYAAHVAKLASVAHSPLSTRPNTGESVAELCTKEGVLPTPEHVVKKWYSEICSPGYNFTRVDKQPGTGHFTQLIWKDTDRLGVGLAVANHANGDSCSYVVARYKNAGNYLDRFDKNVEHGGFDKRNCVSDEEPASKSTIKYYRKSFDSKQTPTSGKSLEEINKEFASKYLSDGENYIRDGRIYHISAQRNFSFTPSKSWLENYKKTASEESKENDKVDVESFVSANLKSEIATRNFKIPKFRVRTDAGEVTDNDESFQSRKKNQLLFMKNGKNPSDSLIDKRKLPEISLSTDDTNILLLRDKRSISSDSVNTKHPITFSSKNILKRSNIVSQNDTAADSNLNSDLPKANLTGEDALQLFFNNQSHAQPGPTNYNNSATKRGLIGKADHILVQHKSRENLENNSTSKGGDEDELDDIVNSGVKRLQTLSYTGSIMHIKQKTSNVKVENRSTQESHLRKQNLTLKLENNNRNFPLNVSKLSAMKKLANTTSLKVPSNYPTRSILTKTTPVNKTHIDKPISNSHNQPAESITKKPSIKHAIRSSNPAIATKQHRLKKSKKHQQRNKKKKSFTYEDANIKERKKVETMKRLINTTNDEDDLVQLLSKIIHKINKVDLKTRQNRNNFNNEIDRFSTLNKAVLNSSLYSKENNGTTHSKHSSLPSRSLLMQLQDFSKALKTNNVMSTSHENSQENEIKTNMVFFVSKLSTLIAKRSITTAQKIRLAEVINTLKNGSHPQAKSEMYPKTSNLIAKYTEEKEQGLGKQKNEPTFREDVIKPFIIQGESDGPDEYSFNEGSVDEGPIEEGSGNVEDGLVGVLSNITHKKDTDGEKEISKKNNVVGKAEISTQDEENNYVSDFMMENQKVKLGKESIRTKIKKTGDSVNNEELNRDANIYAGSTLLLKASADLPEIERSNERSHEQEQETHYEDLRNAASQFMLNVAGPASVSRQFGSSNPNVGLSDMETYEAKHPVSNRTDGNPDKKPYLHDEENGVQMDKGQFHESVHDPLSLYENHTTSPYENSVESEAESEDSKTYSGGKNYQKGGKSSHKYQQSNRFKNNNIKPSSPSDMKLQKVGENSKNEQDKDKDTENDKDGLGAASSHKGNMKEQKEKAKNEIDSTKDGNSSTYENKATHSMSYSEEKQNFEDERTKDKSESNHHKDNNMEDSSRYINNPSDSASTEKGQENNNNSEDMKGYKAEEQKGEKSNNKNEKEYHNSKLPKEEDKNNKKMSDKNFEKEQNGQKDKSESNKYEKEYKSNKSSNDEDSYRKKQKPVESAIYLKEEKEESEKNNYRIGNKNSEDSADNKERRPFKAKTSNGKEEKGTGNKGESISSHEDKEYGAHGGDQNHHGSQEYEHKNLEENEVDSNIPTELRQKYKQLKEEKNKEETEELQKENNSIKTYEKEQDKKLENGEQQRLSNNQAMKGSEESKEIIKSKESDIKSDDRNEKSEKEVNENSEGKMSSYNGKLGNKNFHVTEDKNTNGYYKEKDNFGDNEDKSQQESEKFNSKFDEKKLNFEEEGNNKGNKENINQKPHRKDHQMIDNDDGNSQEEYYKDDKTVNLKTEDTENYSKQKVKNNAKPERYVEVKETHQPAGMKQSKTKPSESEKTLHTISADKEKSLPTSFVSEIVDKVSQKAKQLGLDKSLHHSHPPTAVSAVESLAPINTPLKELPRSTNELEQSALISHNKFRKIHNAPLLSFSSALSSDAQKYAEELISIHNGMLVESPPESRSDQGENLYMDCDPKGLERGGGDATNKWYGEICQQGYDFDVEPTLFNGTQHFTQVAWKSSLSLGLGRVTTKRNHMTCTIIVARYKPAGNIINQFKANLEEGAFDGSVCEELKGDSQSPTTAIHPTPLNHHPQYVSQESKDASGPPITILSSETESDNNNYLTTSLNALPANGLLMDIDEMTTDNTHPINNGLTNQIPSDNSFAMRDTQDFDISEVSHDHNTIPVRFLKTNNSEIISDLYPDVVKRAKSIRYNKKKNQMSNATRKDDLIHNKYIDDERKLSSSKKKMFYVPTKKTRFQKGVVKSHLYELREVQPEQQDSFQEEDVDENDNDVKSTQRIIDSHPVHINQNPKPAHVWSNTKNTDTSIETIELQDTMSSYHNDDSNQSDNLASALEGPTTEDGSSTKAFEGENLGQNMASNLQTLPLVIPGLIGDEHNSKKHNQVKIGVNLGDSRGINRIVNFENLDSEEEKKSVPPLSNKDKQNRQAQKRNVSADELKMEAFMINHEQTPIHSSNLHGDGGHSIATAGYENKVENSEKEQYNQGGSSATLVSNPILHGDNYKKLQQETRKPEQNEIDEEHNQTEQHSGHNTNVSETSITFDTKLDAEKLQHFQEKQEAINSQEVNMNDNNTISIDERLSIEEVNLEGDNKTENEIQDTQVNLNEGEVLNMKNTSNNSTEKMMKYNTKIQESESEESGKNNVTVDTKETKFPSKSKGSNKLLNSSSSGTSDEKSQSQEGSNDDNKPPAKESKATEVSTKAPGEIDKQTEKVKPSKEAIKSSNYGNKPAEEEKPKVVDNEGKKPSKENPKPPQQNKNLSKENENLSAEEAPQKAQQKEEEDPQKEESTSEKIIPSKNKHVTATAHLDRLPKLKRPPENPGQFTIFPAELMNNKVSGTSHEGAVIDNWKNPQHFSQGSEDRLPLENNLPSPQHIQHLILDPSPNSQQSPIQPALIKPFPTESHLASEQMHPPINHIPESESTPDHVTEQPDHLAKQPAKVIDQETEEVKPPFHNLSENIDHATAVAPVTQEGNGEASGLGLLPTFRFASFGSPVILHIGATGFFEDPAAFLRIGLTVHNEFRKLHNAPPLEIDPMLTMQAFQHAQILSSSGFLKHPPNIEAIQGTGENLLLGCYDGAYDISAEEAVLRWYAEVCYPGYYFKQSIISSGTSHFTQVVWDGSKKLGMAKVTRMQNGLRCTYIVARYSPGGNINSGFKKNVKQGNFKEKKDCAKVMQRLVTFESRNMDKVKMVEKEKQVARIEFLHKMKEGEAQVLKEIAEHDQRISETPVNPLKEPPIMHSEKLPDGGPLDKNKEPPSIGELPEKIPMNPEGPSLAGPVNQLEPIHEETTKPSNHLINDPHLHNVLTNQHENSQIRPMKHPFSKPLNDHIIHHSVTFQINKMAPRPEQLNVADALKNLDVEPEPIQINENDPSNNQVTVVTTPGVNNELQTSGLPTELSKSGEKNAVVELDVPSSGAENLSSASTTERINDNVLENIKEQKLSNDDEDDKEGVSETMHPSKITALDVKLNDDDDTVNNIDDAAPNTPSLSTLVSQANNELEANTNENDKGNHHHPPNSLEKEIEEVTKLLDNNDPPGVKDEKLARAEEKLIEDSNLHNLDINSLLKDEDEQLSEEIDKLRDQGNVEFHKNAYKDKTDSQVISALDDEEDISHKKTYKTKGFVGIKEAAQTQPYIKKTPTKKRRKSSSLVATTNNGLNLEDESMISDILAKTHSSMSSEFDDALQSTDQGGQSREKIAIKTKATNVQSLFTKKKKHNCNEKSEGNCVKSKVNGKHANTTDKHLNDKHKINNKSSKEAPNVGEYKTTEKQNEHDEQTDALKSALERARTKSKKLLNHKPTSASTPRFSQNNLQNNATSRISPTKLSTSSSKFANINDISTPKEPKFTATIATPKQLQTTYQQSSQSVNGTPDDISSFEMSALNAHNAYRHTHGARSLRLNHRMSEQAAAYAKKIAKLGTLQHSRTEDGENIATVCRDNNILMSGSDASEIWYREVCDPGYDFVSAQPENAGHFSQVVWKASKEFGIGRAAEMHDGLLCTYIVARYRPAGNFLGEFRDNVQQGRFTSSRCVNYARKDRISKTPLLIMSPSYIPASSIFKRSGIPKIRDPRSVNEEESVEKDKKKNAPTVSSLVPASIKPALGPTIKETSFLDFQTLPLSPNHKRRHYRNNHRHRHRHHHRHHHHRRHHKSKETNTILFQGTNITDIASVHLSLGQNKSTNIMKEGTTNDLPMKLQQAVAGSVKSQIENNTASLLLKPVQEQIQMLSSTNLDSSAPSTTEDKVMNSQTAMNSTNGALQPLRHVVNNSQLLTNPENLTDPNLNHNSTILDEQYDAIPNSYGGIKNISLIQIKNGQSPLTLAKNITTYNNTEDYVNLTTTASSAQKEQENTTSNTSNSTTAEIVPLINTEKHRNGSLHKDVVDNISVYQKLSLKTGQAMNNSTSLPVLEQLKNPSSPLNTPHVNSTLDNKTYNQPVKRLTDKSHAAAINNIGSGVMMNARGKSVNTVKKTQILSDANSVVDTMKTANGDTRRQLNTSKSSKIKTVTKKSNTIKTQKTKSTHSFAKASRRTSQDIENNLETILKAPPSLLELESQVSNRSEETGQLRSLIERSDSYLNKMDDLIESKLNSKSAVIVPQSRDDRVKCGQTGNYNCTFLIDRNAGKSNFLKDLKNSDLLPHLDSESIGKTGDVLNTNPAHSPLIQPLIQNFLTTKESQAPTDTLYRVLSKQTLMPFIGDTAPTESFATKEDESEKMPNIENMETMLQLAKIGTIALKLAKRKEMERAWMINKMREQDILRNVDNGYSDYSKIHPTSSNSLVRTFYPVVSNPTENAYIRNVPLITQHPTKESLQAITSKTWKLLPPHHNMVSKLPQTKAETQTRNMKIGGQQQMIQESGNQEFIEASLNAHNNYRFVHNANPLLLDKKLIERAATRASYIAAQHGLEYATPNNDEDGENIALVCKDVSSRDKLTGPDATRIWYNQVCNPEYVFNVDRDQDNADKFMQLVWKDTKRFGIGRSTFQKDGKFCTVVVAHYFPPAGKSNVRSNVLQGVFDHSSYCSGLGKSSIPEVQTETTQTAIKSASENTQDFRLEALNLQNELRGIHNAPLMELDDSMCIQAEKYATQMAKAGTAKRNTVINDGENVMKSCNVNNVEVSADEAVRKWYNEVCNPGYSFLRGDVPGGVSSFTQMVWVTTKRFGIGKATSQEDGMFCTYIVGLYREKGNANNEYYTNVLKGDFDFSYCESLGKQHRVSYDRYQRHNIENKRNHLSTVEVKKSDSVTNQNHTSQNISIDHKTRTLQEQSSQTKSNTNIVQSNRISNVVYSLETVNIKTDLNNGNNKGIDTIETHNSPLDTVTKRNRIPFKTKKSKKNKSPTKKKKVVIDNLMQLNDIVMKVNSKKKHKKNTKHQKQKSHHKDNTKKKMT